MAEGLRRPQGGCAEQKYREFCNTLSTGICQAFKVEKGPADDRVERSLFQRAVGYTFDATGAEGDGARG